MKMIFLSLVLFFIGCESMNSFKNNISGSSRSVENAIGKDESYLQLRFGKPYQVLVFENITLYYFARTVFFVKDSVVQNYENLNSIKYEIIIEALNRSNRNTKIQSYIMASGNDNNPTDSLEFVDYTSQIEPMIDNSGLFRLAKQNENPDQIILVSYGISDPINDTKVWSEPIYSWIPNSSVNTTYRDSNGYSATAVSESNNGGLKYQGSVMRSSTETNYNRYLVLTAIDGNIFFKTKKIKEIWKVKSSTFGATSNLKKAVMAMSIATYPYWGKYSDGKIRVSGFYDDPGAAYFSSMAKEK